MHMRTGICMQGPGSEPLRRCHGGAGPGGKAGAKPKPKGDKGTPSALGQPRWGRRRWPPEPLELAVARGGGG
eukprot:SAG22_NODE_12382_length_444_cov_15.594203_1_plen_71_part_10